MERYDLMTVGDQVVDYDRNMNATTLVLTVIGDSNDRGEV